MNNFIFFEEDAVDLPNIKFIFLINKMEFIKKIKEYQQLFNDILKCSVTPEKMLTDIESGRLKFQDAIKNSELLLGILLGFGEHNARLYERRQKLERPKKTEQLLLKSIIPQPNFSTVEEEIDYLNSLLLPFGDYNYSPIYAPIVHFVADHSHPETILLDVKYKKLCGKSLLFMPMVIC